MKASKNELRLLRIPSAIVAAGWLCFGLLAGAPVNAQNVPATAAIPRVAFPISTVGNISTVGPQLATAANAANFSYGVAANGSVFANAPSTMPTAGGSSIPITVAGSIPKSSVAAAFGRFAVKAHPLLSIGNALYDLAKELNYQPLNTDGTVPTFTKSYAIDGFEYRLDTGQAWYPSGMAAIDAAFPGCFNRFPPVYVTWYTGPPSGTPVGSALYIQCPSAQGQMLKRPYTDALVVPASVDEIVAAINAKTTWPSTSAIARLVVDMMAKNESFTVSPTAITGPATSPAVSTTYNNPVTNVSTVTTSTNNYTYGPTTVTTTNVTTTRDVNNATGVSTPTGTVTTAPITPESPKTECELRPQSIGCRNLDTPADAVPKKTETVTWASENLGFGEGSCPAAVAWHTSKLDGEIGFQKVCDFTTTYVRPLIIMFSFLAAFFIVAPVKAD